MEPVPNSRVIRPSFGSTVARSRTETEKWGSLQRWVVGCLFACFIGVNLGVLALVGWIVVVETAAIRAGTLDTGARIVTTPVLLALIAASATQLGLTAYALGKQITLNRNGGRR